ncbi:hypothetical protein DM01DRAFT_1382518 [Hesseltinella vesiculosa]|uniref:Uncharacterized protein n=1 Tax=Hesseltinella vesiculosa TaxID=101127 RepID=A0A1X2GM40_9FUNG|nr:hypothetical protein DM01DRAFT_1382518 [Hesseltinella vesiculosa]
MGEAVCEDRPSEFTAQYTQTTDHAVHQLLTKLDEGMQTVTNLRSILTMKTAELQELLAQLELTNQAISQVETTTTNIEAMLKDLGLSNNASQARDLLVNAQASLDSAIKSANHIYDDHRRRPSVTTAKEGSLLPASPSTIPSVRTTSRIRYKPDTKHLLRQINEQLRDLQVDAGNFFSAMGTTNDIQALQKAFVDLDLAKTVALSAKSNLKRRKILLTSARKRVGNEQIKLLGDKIHEGVNHWRTYTRGAPLLMNGEDILVHLELQDSLLDRQAPSYHNRLSMDFKSRGNSPTHSSSSSTSNPSNGQARSSWLPPANRDSTTSNTNQQRRRSSSISSTSSIPVFTSNSLAASLSSHRYSQPSPPPPVPSLPASHASSSSKRHSHQPRHQATTRVKANVGVSRVRTSSLTTRTKENVTSASTPTTNVSTLPPPPPTLPTPVSTTEAANQSASPSTPASKLKTPNQRGPGSTLRIRSMLAKRQQPSTRQTEPSKP